MSPVSAGLILIKVSCVLVVEHLPFVKETREAPAKSVLFQMVCMEKNNNVLHIESLLKIKTYLN